MLASLLYESTQCLSLETSVTDSQAGTAWCSSSHSHRPRVLNLQAVQVTVTFDWALLSQWQVTLPRAHSSTPGEPPTQGHLFKTFLKCYISSHVPASFVLNMESCSAPKTTETHSQRQDEGNLWVGLKSPRSVCLHVIHTVQASKKTHTSPLLYSA